MGFPRVQGVVGSTSTDSGVQGVLGPLGRQLRHCLFLFLEIQKGEIIFQVFREKLFLLAFLEKARLFDFFLADLGLEFAKLLLWML